jgi:hypothetical protein
MSAMSDVCIPINCGSQPMTAFAYCPAVNKAFIKTQRVVSEDSQI